MGVDQSQVSRRLEWSSTAPHVVQGAVCDELFTEGHVEAVYAMSHIPDNLSDWLTTDEARAELAETVLKKHRGGSAGKKPTVRNVRRSS